MRALSVGRVRELAGEYLDTERMVWLMVGDAATQRDRLQALGLGEPIPVDRAGRPIVETRRP